MSLGRCAGTGAFVCVFSLCLLTNAPARAQDTDACIAANERALALQKADKLLDARKELSTCASSTCPDAVKQSCGQRLAEVVRAIPSVIFSVKDGSGHDVTGVRLTIDGVPQAQGAEATAIVLNPGDHEFRFDAPGQEPVVKRYVLHQGEQNRREEVVIGAAGSPDTSSTSDRAATSTPSGEQPGTDRGSTQRTIGLVVGGVGVAGLVAGGIFGALSMSAHSSYEQNCGSNIGAPTGYCNQAGVNGQSDAATKGTVSTIAFIGGGVALAAGAALFLLAPSSSNTQVGIGPGTFTFQGRF